VRPVAVIRFPAAVVNSARHRQRTRAGNPARRFAHDRRLRARTGRLPGYHGRRGQTGWHARHLWKNRSKKPGIPNCNWRLPAGSICRRQAHRPGHARGRIVTRAARRRSATFTSGRSRRTALIALHNLRHDAGPLPGSRQGRGSVHPIRSSTASGTSTATRPSCVCRPSTRTAIKA